MRGGRWPPACAAPATVAAELAGPGSPRCAFGLTCVTLFAGCPPNPWSGEVVQDDPVFRLALGRGIEAAVQGEQIERFAHVGHRRAKRPVRRRFLRVIKGGSL